MSQDENALQALVGLTPDEVEVECLIRDLDLTDKANLLEVLKAEKRDPSIKPTKSHATNLKEELDQCNNQYKVLSGLVTGKQGITTEQLNTLKIRFKHWQERTCRLKGRFHQDNDVDKLINHFRRLKQLIEAQAEELHNPGIPITNYPFGSSTTLVSSIATSNIKSTTEQNPQQSAIYSSKVDQDDANYAAIQNTLEIPITQVTWTRNPDGAGLPITLQPSANAVRFSVAQQADQLHFPENNNLSNLMTPTIEIISNHEGRPNYVNYAAPQVVQSNYRNVYNPVDISCHTPAMSFNQPLTPPVYQKRYEPKWNIYFTGLPSGLDVHDFIFRIESQAKREQIQLPMLDAILPKFLKDTAEKWYWVYVRKFPNTTYFHLRQALLQRFSSTESERETRRFIETKRQKFREPVADYLLELECLNGRLLNPFSEQELVEIMRENVVPELQQVTLTLHIATIEDLRMICQKYEKLWARTTRHMPNSFSKSICSVARPTDDVYSMSTSTSTGADSYDMQASQMPFSPQVEAVHRSVQQQSRKPMGDGNPSQNYLTCWNCHDIGHRYQDCPVVPQHLFCYGCGKSGVIKPQCSQCQKHFLKYQPGVNYSGQFHPAQIATREQATIRTTNSSSGVVKLHPESSRTE